jgi:hypothetical protein
LKKVINNSQEIDNNSNITQFKKRRSVNVGLIVAAAVFIYLIVTVVLFLTRKDITAYEVRQGSILRDLRFTGVALRSEQIVRVPTTGYIYYFPLEGTKVGRKSDVYCLSLQPLNISEDAFAGSFTLSAAEKESLLIMTQSWVENYDSSKFSQTTSYKDYLGGILNTRNVSQKQAYIAEKLADGSMTAQLITAEKDGDILYTIDGFENLQPSDITADMFGNSQYTPNILQSGVQASAGTPAYKLVTSDTWSLVIMLSESQANELEGLENIKVSFLKDSETAWASFSVIRKAESILGVLTFQNAMVRYIKDRYLEVELVIEDAEGLKIPVSSVTTKPFYEVPEDYIIYDATQSSSQVLLSEGATSKTSRVTIYGKNADANTVYISGDELSAGKVIIRTDSSESISLSGTVDLTGVYDISKGYAVFRQVKILSESDEYYIVQSGSAYGLSNFDHIALDASTVTDNELVYK